MFDNFHEYAEMFPDEVLGPPRFCRPLLDHGAALQAIRDRLALRAGPTLAPCLPGLLLGHVERIADGNIEGWALNDADRANPVRLHLLTSGSSVTEVIANHYRPDLDRAG